MQATPKTRAMLVTGKRLLFASEFQPGSTGQGLEYGFRELGWAVQQIEARQFFPLLPSRAARILAKPLQPLFQAAYNQSILEAAKRDEPQVFITVKGSLILRRTLDELRRMCIKTVMFYPDYHFDHPGLELESFDAYDLFVTSKSFQLEYLEKRLGIHRVGPDRAAILKCR